MKILVFTSLYPNDVWTHHGVFIKERMTRFARHFGAELKVVAPVPYYPPIKGTKRYGYSQIARRHEIEGIEVWHPRYFMLPKVGMSTHGLAMYLSSVNLVRRLRREFDFDLIDAHYVYPDGLAGILLGRRFDRPVVLSARGSDINLFPRFGLVRRSIKYALDRASGIISVCQALKDEMVELGVPESDIAVISNGVDHEKFHPVPRDEARARLGVPDRRILLSVGNLIPRKGFDYLIRAFDILQRDHGARDVHLVIAGEGESRPQLEAIIRERRLSDDVTLVGDVRHGALRDWYNVADLFCLMSDREGYPNVLMESMACGTPVVATRIWGVPEIVTSEELGLMTEREDRAIAATLQDALGRQWDRQKVHDAVAERTWESVAESVNEIFRRALERGGRERATPEHTVQSKV